MRTPVATDGAQQALHDEARSRELDRKTNQVAAQLTVLPVGVVARNRRTTSPPTTAGFAQPTLQTSAQVEAGRLYQVSAPSLACYANGATGIAVVEALLTYTTDGTTPGVGSTVMRRGDVNVDTGAHGATLNVVVTWASTISGKLSVLLSYVGAVLGGASSVGIVGSAENPIELLIIDLGPDPGLSGTIY